MKNRYSFVVWVIPCLLTAWMLLAGACSSPVQEGGRGTSGSGNLAAFTISFGGGRMAYGPSSPGGPYPTVGDLKFVVTFTNPDSSVAKTIIEDGPDTDVIEDTIAPGVYDIAAQIYLRSDGSLYADGGAVNNPVTINPGPNTVQVQVSFDPSVRGDGSPGNPFKVYDVATLKKIGSGADGWDKDKYYKQIMDISLSGEWTPIGTDAPGDDFTGSFDGRGKTIAGLYINAPASNFQGLFGYIGAGGVVKNVGLVNVNITGNSFIGAAAGRSYGTLQNCWSTGAVSGGTLVNGTGSIGGVVGRSAGTLQNCWSTANVSGIDRDVGGVAGRNHGIMQNCYATGTVNGQHGVGGVAGLNSDGGTMEYCYATGNITGSDNNVGGVAGINDLAGVVRYCYATGVVGGEKSHVGGVVGINQRGSVLQQSYSTGNVTSTDTTVGSVGGVVGLNLKSTVEYCYATGNVSGVGSGTGGVVGSNSTDDTDPTQAFDAVVRHCYATGNVSGSSNVGGVVGHNNRSSALSIDLVVAYCYATGTVNGTNLVGGVVGGMGSLPTAPGSMSMQNCAALNPNVAASSAPANRVAGSDTSPPSTLADNFARQGMTVAVMGGSSSTPSGGPSNLGDLTGCDVGTNSNSSDGNGGYSSQSFWQQTLFAGVYADAWTWGGNGLPILKNMPGRNQNPSVN